MIRDTVKFSGTASSDGDALFVIVAQDPVETQRAISEQIALLLATQFEAAPHPVGKRFRKGAMRTLNAPATGSALAFSTGDFWGAGRPNPKHRERAPGRLGHGFVHQVGRDYGAGPTLA